MRENQRLLDFDQKNPSSTTATISRRYPVACSSPTWASRGSPHLGESGNARQMHAFARHFSPAAQLARMTRSLSLLPR